MNRSPETKEHRTHQAMLDSIALEELRAKRRQKRKAEAVARRARIAVLVQSQLRERAQKHQPELPFPPTDGES